MWKSQTEWVDDIVSAWVGDDPVNYAYHIACLYSTLNTTLISRVITEVNMQQARWLEEVKESPYKPL
jgi:hypothetical protein